MNRFSGIMGFLLFVVAHREAGSAPLQLTVQKTRVVNSRNEPVRLRGVNTASLEWSSDGEGHILETVQTAINEWHVNVVRLPLAQDRWFGKANEQKDEGKAYRALVDQIVETCAAGDATSSWICTGRMRASGASRSASTSCPTRTAWSSGRAARIRTRIIPPSSSTCTTSRIR